MWLHGSNCSKSMFKTMLFLEVYVAPVRSRLNGQLPVKPQTNLVAWFKLFEFVLSSRLNWLLSVKPQKNVVAWIKLLDSYLSFHLAVKPKSTSSALSNDTFCQRLQLSPCRRGALLHSVRFKWLYMPAKLSQQIVLAGTLHQRLPMHLAAHSLIVAAKDTKNDSWVTLEPFQDIKNDSWVTLEPVQRQSVDTVSSRLKGQLPVKPKTHVVA